MVKWNKGFEEIRLFLERVPREVKYYAIDLFEAVQAVILVLTSLKSQE